MAETLYLVKWNDGPDSVREWDSLTVSGVLELLDRLAVSEVAYTRENLDLIVIAEYQWGADGGYEQLRIFMPDQFRATFAERN
jgi:phage host-nuclease inhibitor protein Gam